MVGRPLEMAETKMKIVLCIVPSILTLLYETDFPISSYCPLSVSYLDLEATACAVGEAVATGSWSADRLNIER